MEVGGVGALDLKNAWNGRAAEWQMEVLSISNIFLILTLFIN